MVPHWLLQRKLWGVLAGVHRMDRRLPVVQQDAKLPQLWVPVEHVRCAHQLLWAVPERQVPLRPGGVRLEPARYSCRLGHLDGVSGPPRLAAVRHVRLRERGDRDLRPRHGRAPRQRGRGRRRRERRARGRLGLGQRRLRDEGAGRPGGQGRAAPDLPPGRRLLRGHGGRVQDQRARRAALRGPGGRGLPEGLALHLPHVRQPRDHRWQQRPREAGLQILRPESILRGLAKRPLAHHCHGHRLQFLQLLLRRQAQHRLREHERAKPRGGRGLADERPPSRQRQRHAGYRAAVAPPASQ
mmetsp:Transcript_57632/g.185146  ORF Transcript_57632/g.185146 Transcript_57632/m.185146 type:complete len:298 (-) Transcript_57632:666-1559(-)